MTMWSELIITGTLASAAGALAVPAARNLMLGDVKKDWLAGELELDRIDADQKTVLLKGDAVFRVFKFFGVAYDAKVMEQQELMLKGRAALLHSLGELGCSVRLFAVKRQRDISFEASWPSPALAEIGEAERILFQSSYYTDWYLLVSAPSFRPLLEACGKVAAMAVDYRPVLLSRPEDPAEPCPLTGFLNFLVCGDLRDDLPAISESISGNLPASDLEIGKDGILTTHIPARMLQRIIAIRSWPELVDGRLFQDILSLSGDIEISQICVPWDRDQALILYKRQLRAQLTALFGNAAMAAECEATIQLLSEGNTTVFHTQLQIVVRDGNEENLDALVQSVCEILGHRRVLHSIETDGAPICWFNRIPKNEPKRLGSATRFLRPLILREQNVAALWAFNNSPIGLMKSPLGDRPVRFFRTPGGQAYAFQFHVSNKPQSIGNYLVFAPTGGGKSTLMMHLLGGLAKFDGVRSYIFDSKEGARFMIEAMGGVYQGYDELQLNPLDVGEDTPANRHRIYMVLKAMAAGTQPGDDDDAIFSHAVKLAFTLNVPDRTINQIFEYAFPRRTSLRRAFARWVIDGKDNAGLNAHVFNAPHDSLGGFLQSAHMVGINMNEALDDLVVGPPVVAHISAAISKSAATSSRGFNIFIDEAAKLLQNDGFKALAVEMYREYRKLNGSVGLAFQDPAALFRSGVAEAFLENTATLLFLPNSQATQASLEPFNLNEEQIGFILGGGDRKQGERRVLVVKRDAAAGLDESAILDVDLTPLGDSLRFYRAGSDANRDLAELKKQWGDAWQQHL
jgi:type IV secretion system protein VirB4